MADDNTVTVPTFAVADTSKKYAIKKVGRTPVTRDAFVYYIDASTGEVLTSLDGYTLWENGREVGDASGTPANPTEVEKGGEAAVTETKEEEAWNATEKYLGRGEERSGTFGSMQSDFGASFGPTGEAIKSMERSAENNWGYIDKNDRSMVERFISIVPVVGITLSAARNLNNIAAVEAYREDMGLPALTSGERVKALVTGVESVVAEEEMSAIREGKSAVKDQVKSDINNIGTTQEKSSFSGMTGDESSKSATTGGLASGAGFGATPPSNNTSSYSFSPVDGSYTASATSMDADAATDGIGNYDGLNSNNTIGNMGGQTYQDIGDVMSNTKDVVSMTTEQYNQVIDTIAKEGLAGDYEDYQNIASVISNRTEGTGTDDYSVVSGVGPKGNYEFSAFKDVKSMTDAQKEALRSSPQWEQAKEAYEDVKANGTTTDATFYASNLVEGAVEKLQSDIPGLEPTDALPSPHSFFTDPESRSIYTADAKLSTFDSTNISAGAVYADNDNVGVRQNVSQLEAMGGKMGEVTDVATPVTPDGTTGFVPSTSSSLTMQGSIADQENMSFNGSSGPKGLQKSSTEDDNSSRGFVGPVLDYLSEEQSSEEQSYVPTVNSVKTVSIPGVEIDGLVRADNTTKNQQLEDNKALANSWATATQDEDDKTLESLREAERSIPTDISFGDTDSSSTVSNAAARDVYAGAKKDESLGGTGSTKGFVSPTVQQSLTGTGSLPYTPNPSAALSQFTGFGSAISDAVEAAARGLAQGIYDGISRTAGMVEGLGVGGRQVETGWGAGGTGLNSPSEGYSHFGGTGLGSTNSENYSGKGGQDSPSEGARNEDTGGQSAGYGSWSDGGGNETAYDSKDSGQGGTSATYSSGGNNETSYSTSKDSGQGGTSDTYSGGDGSTSGTSTGWGGSSTNGSGTSTSWGGSSTSTSGGNESAYDSKDSSFG